MTTPVETPAEEPDRTTEQPGETDAPLYGAPEDPDPHFGEPGDDPGPA